MIDISETSLALSLLYKQQWLAIICRDGAFCILIRNFGPQLPPKSLEAWLDGLSGNLERYYSSHEFCDQVRLYGFSLAV